MKKTIFTLIFTLSILLSACNVDTQSKGGDVIQSQAIEGNFFSDVYHFFFYDVVCSDPTNSMYQCD